MKVKNSNENAKKYLFFPNGSKDVYNRMLVESIIDELHDMYSKIECKYITNFKDIFKANAVVISGKGDLSRTQLLTALMLKKPLVLYHASDTIKNFQKIVKHGNWTITSRKEEQNYDYFPSPVLLSDLTTHKRINRIWSKEKLVSKRGCIGIIGLNLEEKLQKNLARILDLLVEDLDLNIIFIPIIEKDLVSMKEVLSRIKYSANSKYIDTYRYAPTEVLGIISKIDIVITSDKEGAVCAMAANRPVVCLNPDNSLRELVGDLVQEDILLDIDTLSDDEIYTKIKIAWVHRDAIVGQMQQRVNELKVGAGEGIKQLNKRLMKGFN